MWTKGNNENNNLKQRFAGNLNKFDSNYEDLSEVCDQTNKQYWGSKTHIPWRAICLALFLVVIGFALLVLCLLISTGFVQSVEPNDQLLVLLFLGLLMFIPGFYHMRIAFYAYYGYDGYTFDHIPDFD